jgi:ubiquinone/menaquinone biosynthesis C-methylase UbiE
MQVDTKEFYDRLKFPGYYSQQDITCHLVDIKNPYLWTIDQALSNGISVLDIGCGSGYISNLFAQRYPDSDFSAIDFSAALDVGKDFSKSVDQNNITWIKQDFLQYKFKTQYDVVICQGVFHHIKECEQALDKIKQLVKPGGTIVFGVYHPFGKFLKKLFKLKYHSEILRIDQEENVFETAYTCNQVADMFQDSYQLVTSYPTTLPILSHLRALINYQNGGLTTYVWKQY